MCWRGYLSKLFVLKVLNPIQGEMVAKVNVIIIIYVLQREAKQVKKKKIHTTKKRNVKLAYDLMVDFGWVKDYLL